MTATTGTLQPIEARVICTRLSLLLLLLLLNRVAEHGKLELLEALAQLQQRHAALLLLLYPLTHSLLLLLSYKRKFSGCLVRCIGSSIGWY